jgi:hypothetical protein
MRLKARSKKTAEDTSHIMLETMLELIQDMLPFFDKPKSSARYYLELYSLNYRPAGDYQNITSDKSKS